VTQTGPLLPPLQRHRRVRRADLAHRARLHRLDRVGRFQPVHAVVRGNPLRPIGRVARSAGPDPQADLQPVAGSIRSRRSSAPDHMDLEATWPAGAFLSFPRQHSRGTILSPALFRGKL